MTICTLSSPLILTASKNCSTFICHPKNSYPSNWGQSNVLRLGLIFEGSKRLSRLLGSWTICLVGPEDVSNAKVLPAVFYNFPAKSTSNISGFWTPSLVSIVPGRNCLMAQTSTLKWSSACLSSANISFLNLSPAFSSFSSILESIFFELLLRQPWSPSASSDIKW